MCMTLADGHHVFIGIAVHAAGGSNALSIQPPLIVLGFYLQ
jgi:hypothetical protein